MSSPKTHSSGQLDPGLPTSHLFLALVIVAVWGTNFVVIKNSLSTFPPFYFAALRYFFCISANRLFLCPDQQYPGATFVFMDWLPE